MTWGDFSIGVTTLLAILSFILVLIAICGNHSTRKQNKELLNVLINNRKPVIEIRNHEIEQHDENDEYLVSILLKNTGGVGALLQDVVVLYFTNQKWYHCYDQINLEVQPDAEYRHTVKIYPSGMTPDETDLKIRITYIQIDDRGKNEPSKYMAELKKKCI